MNIIDLNDGDTRRAAEMKEALSALVQSPIWVMVRNIIDKYQASILRGSLLKI